MAAQQILKNTSAIVEETFNAGAADGTITVTVTKADGTTLTSGAAVHDSGGTYSYVIQPQAELDSLTLTWTGAWVGVTQSIVSHVEIVGDNLFTVAQARAFDDRVLNDLTRYPDEDVREARERVTDLFEEVCNISFIPRYARDVLDGTNSDTLELGHRHPNRVIAGSIDGVTLTAPQIAQIMLYSSGRAIWQTGGMWPANRHNIVVAYEHGYPSPPADIRRAALVLARYELVANDISDRMISFDNDLGTVRLSIPGKQYPTGIPVVDATLARYDESALLIS